MSRFGFNISFAVYADLQISNKTGIDIQSNLNLGMLFYLTLPPQALAAKFRADFLLFDIRP